ELATEQPEVALLLKYPLPTRVLATAAIGAVSSYAWVPTRSVTHLVWICQVQWSVPPVVQPLLLLPLTLENLIQVFVGWFDVSSKVLLEVKSCGPDEPPPVELF